MNGEKIEDPGNTEIALESYAYGGEILGHMHDGRAIFVPFGIPGELVRVHITEEKQNYSRGVVSQILKASPDRIEPICTHYTFCGGCHYQHLPYPKQLEAKQAMFIEQMRRMGGFSDLPIRTIIPSPLETRYRNTVQFHLSSTGKVGYLAANSHEMIEITECHLPDTMLDSLWRKLIFDSPDGMERIELRVGTDEQPLMTIQSESSELPEMDTDLPISIVHQSPAGNLVIAGDGFTTHEISGKTFRVSSSAFFQVNPSLTKTMVDILLDNIHPTKSMNVLDVYCGVGLFSAFLAPLVERCTGVELSSSACQDYAFNLDQHENVELYQGKAEVILPGLAFRPDITIVDPPRAGMEKHALNAILEMKPMCIAYISCDPATLARDLRRLVSGGYELTMLQPIDMFPQTYHMECMCILKSA
jgi:23S rRNA (uracil1939-C5)-methyltransferase